MNKSHEYVAKPIVVEAIQFDRNKFLEVEKLIGKLANVTLGINYVRIKNDKIIVFASVGEWIVLEQHGIFFKLTNPQFVEKYEKTDPVLTDE